MPSIQSFTMTCDGVNDYGTFSEGDPVKGKLTLVLYKEITVDCLYVKVKGDANVRWTHKSGDHTYTYSSHRRPFKLKQFLIAEDSPDKVVPQGKNVYDFCFNIPTGGMPSSFRGSHGKIVYRLEAKLSRSWKMARTLEKELKFVSKAYPNLQSLMMPSDFSSVIFVQHPAIPCCPDAVLTYIQPVHPFTPHSSSRYFQKRTSRHIGSTKKEMGFFSKGNVHMDVIVDRRAYAPGETLAVVAKINNTSSKDMAPKFSLIQNVVYRAQGHTKSEHRVIFKQVDPSMKPNTERTARCAVKIPSDVIPTIQTCDIISLEYHLKVYLDISFASDPEVVFPITICHPELISALQPHAAVGPYPSTNFVGPSNSDFHSPAMAAGPYAAGAHGGSPIHNINPPAVAMGPYSYGYKGAQSYSAPPPQYPAQPAYQRNPQPQLASAYGDPYTAPSSTVHPPPTVPAFHPPPSAPAIPTPPSNVFPTAPMYNLQPSAPLMDTNFLAQTDEPPPSYSVLFPPSDTDKSDAN